MSSGAIDSATRPVAVDDVLLVPLDGALPWIAQSIKAGLPSSRVMWRITRDWTFDQEKRWSWVLADHELAQRSSTM